MARIDNSTVYVPAAGLYEWLRSREESRLAAGVSRDYPMGVIEARVRLFRAGLTVDFAACGRAEVCAAAGAATTASGPSDAAGGHRPR